MPQISVIVPVYKVEKYIHRCVDSILNQTFSDFELILVDDGSPDNCGAICDEYAAKDHRVIVIHQENGGLSAARNAGIDWAFENSDSEWLTFVDSDDWVHPQLLEKLLEAALRHHAAVSMCGYSETDGVMQWETVGDTSPQLCSAEELLMEHPVNATIACGKLYSKSCFEQIRYPAGKLHEDEFVTYRILFAQKNAAFLPVAMYAYYTNPQGITKSSWNPGRLDALEAKEEQIQFYREMGCAALEERIVRDYARNLLAQYRQYRKLNGNRRVTLCFQKKARWFRSKYIHFYANDRETRLHLFWVAHPLISKLYRFLKNIWN